MAQSDQAIRDIVAQLTAPQQPAPAAPAMGSMMATTPVPAQSNFAMMPFPQQQPAAQFPPPVSPNLIAAQQQMNLSPQEQALYSRHLTNLNGPGGVNNPDGSRSTLYQSVQEHGGKFYSIPTVWDGKREVQPYTRQDGSTMDVANPTALANVSKAGWDTFPSYPTADEADSRYDQMHGYMDQDTADYMKSIGR
jgi:hypothetical protein